MFFDSFIAWESVSIPVQNYIPEFDRHYAIIPGPLATSRAFNFSHFANLLFFKISFFINSTLIFVSF